jgi:hypothetical protein
MRQGDVRFEAGDFTVLVLDGGGEEVSKELSPRGCYRLPIEKIVGMDCRRVSGTRVTAVSQLTASLSPNGRLPPQDPRKHDTSTAAGFLPVTAPQTPPLRPERHAPNSIAMLRRRLIVVVASAAEPVLRRGFALPEMGATGPSFGVWSLVTV